MLGELQTRLKEEELKLRLTDEAVAFLVERGYDETFGARPLRRAIQRYLEDPLSEKILTAEFDPGDEIEASVTAEGDSLDFKVLSSTNT
jgi:ATP-dependent Clp protease ATP-binding subunit ClpA